MADELRRFEDENALLRLPGFNELPREKQDELRAKLASDLTQVNVEAMRKVAQSRVAENDMRVKIDAINQLNQDRKAYHATGEFETGSGNIKISVRGGDIRFILPVVALVAAALIIVIAILWR